MDDQSGDFPVARDCGFCGVDAKTWEPTVNNDAPICCSTSDCFRASPMPLTSIDQKHSALKRL